jgi:hypothetical protein
MTVFVPVKFTSAIQLQLQSQKPRPFSFILLQLYKLDNIIPSLHLLHTRTMTSAIQSITSALPSLGRARLLINSSDDVVIVSACRTAITKVSPDSCSVCMLQPSIHTFVPPQSHIHSLTTCRRRKEASRIVYLKISWLPSSRRL